MNKLIVMLLLVLSSNAFSMLVSLPDAPFIVDYQGKLYDVVRKDLGHIGEMEDLESKLIPQQDWHSIIAKGTRIKANRLLRKLASYLPKDELWQYIKTGLLRNDGFEYDRVADNAYALWSPFASMSELSAIRINPQYHRNLSVLVHWKGLFRPYKNNIKFDKLENVVKRLSKYSMNIEYSKRQLLRNLRVEIASSTDKEKLINLMHHKNFHVALASWYALSKLAPKEVAYEIMTDAITRSDA